MKKQTFLLVLCLMLAWVTVSYSQLETIAGGLKSPFGLTFDAQGNLWYNELGTGNGDGSVSMRSPDGQTTELINGLPSVFLPDLEELAGCWRTFLTNDHAIVISGENAAPIAESLLFFERAKINSAAALSPADASSIVAVGPFSRAQEGVEGSNPFSVATNPQGEIFVADAAANAVYKWDAAAGSFSIFARFPNIPNPTPIGPPFINVVPTKLIGLSDGNFLLSTLSGFPFPVGGTSVYKIDPQGNTSVYATGLTMAVDLAIDPTDGNPVVLQFAEFGFAPTPGFVPGTSQAVKIMPDGQLDTLFKGFGPSSGMAIDAHGDIYVSSLFAGIIQKWTRPGVAILQLIHAAPTETVDVWANGSAWLSSVAYRTATPFMEVPARVSLELTLQPTNPFTDAMPYNATLNLEEGKTYLAVVEGTWPDGDAFPLSIAVQEVQLPLPEAGQVGLQFFHGVPDAPAVSILSGGGTLFEDISYGQFGSDYVVANAGQFSLDIASGGNTLAGYIADLEFWKGNTAVVFASGLLEDGGDFNYAFEPWVALSNGGTFPLFRRAALEGKPIATTGVSRAALAVFPNPAVETARLQVKIPSSDRVQIALYNASGQLVRQVLNETLPEGMYQQDLQVQDLTGGMYFIRIHGPALAAVLPLVVR